MRLKPAGARADNGAMLVYSSTALVLSEASILSVRPSLNAPVVNIEELPVAPARAAIVVYSADYGDLSLALGLRSLESGRVALFLYRKIIPLPEELPAAVEDALTFAEGLGFFFDDDLLQGAQGASTSVGLEHWTRLMGGEEVYRVDGPVGPPAPAATASLAPSDQDLLPDMEDLLASPQGEEPLDAVAGAVAGSEARPRETEDAKAMGEDDLTRPAMVAKGRLETPEESDLECPAKRDGAEPNDPFGSAAEELAGSTQDLLSAAGAPDAAPTGGSPREVPLSKFRDAPSAASGGEGAAAREAAAPTPAERVAPPATSVNTTPAKRNPAQGSPPAPDNALGRIPIVKKRLGGDPGRASFLTRLLGSF